MLKGRSRQCLSIEHADRLSIHLLIVTMLGPNLRPPCQPLRSSPEAVTSGNLLSAQDNLTEDDLKDVPSKNCP